MKAWTGVGIAAIAMIIALVVDPAAIFGFETLQLKFAFAAVLLSMAGLAFVLGQSTPEINFSRQIAIWSAGLAAIAVIASNMDILTGTSPLLEPVAEVKKPYVPRKARVKKPESTAIYVPDTPKLERIERVVTPDLLSINPLEIQDDKVEIPNILAKKNSKLSEDWKLSSDQKEQFRKYLESQGLEYDPETAFIPPAGLQRNPQAESGDAASELN